MPDIIKLRYGLLPVPCGQWLSHALIIAMLGMGVATVAATPINEQCPVTPDEPAEPHLTVEFEGRPIGFCCRACIRQLRENPEAYRTNLPPPAPSEHPIFATDPHRPHDR